jgi:hypothetical protein
MKKTQKIWLWISIAMFAIPELIWGPTLGYTSFYKNIYEINNRAGLLLILAMQIVGVFLFLVYFSKIFKSKNVLYWLITVLLIFFLIKSLLVFYVLFATHGMWS